MAMESYTVEARLKSVDTLGPSLLKISALFEKIGKQVIGLNSEVGLLGRSNGLAMTIAKAHQLSGALSSAGAAAKELKGLTLGGMTRSFEASISRAKELEGVMERIGRNQLGGTRGGSGGPGGRQGGINAAIGEVQAGIFSAGFIASPVISAIKQAAELNTQMVGIDAIRPMDEKTMAGLRAAIFKAASPTVFSNVDVGGMAKLLATSTSLSVPEIDKILPVMAQFADTQSLFKGVPWQTSVKGAIDLAHQAQLYTPEQLRPFLDKVTRASILTGGSTPNLTNALKYFGPTAKAGLGMSDDSVIAAVALMDRLGVSGSRGGTSLLAGLTRSVPGVFGSGLLTGKSMRALHDMNLVDKDGKALVFDKEGKFDLPALMTRLVQFHDKLFASMPPEKARQEMMRDLQQGFGTNGARTIGLLMSDAALEQWRIITENMAKLPGTSEVQNKFANEATMQKFKTAQTNFNSLMAEIGDALLPDVNHQLDRFNHLIPDLTVLVRENHPAVRALAEALLGLSAAVAFSGVVKGLEVAFYGLQKSMAFAGLIEAGMGAKAAAPVVAGSLLSGGPTAIAALTALAIYKKATETTAERDEAATAAAAGWDASGPGAPSAEYPMDRFGSGRRFANLPPNYLRRQPGDDGTIETNALLRLILQQLGKPIPAVIDGNYLNRYFQQENNFSYGGPRMGPSVLDPWAYYPNPGSVR